jgi:hypothetical protein
MPRKCGTLSYQMHLSCISVSPRIVQITGRSTRRTSSRTKRTLSYARQISLVIKTDQFSIMDKSLTPQAFASNNLNRSITERRNKNFLEERFPSSLFLVVSNGKVVVWRKTKTELRWFKNFELQNLAYEPYEDVLSRRAGVSLCPGNLTGNMICDKCLCASILSH